MKVQNQSIVSWRWWECTWWWWWWWWRRWWMMTVSCAMINSCNDIIVAMATTKVRGCGWMMMTTIKNSSGSKDATSCLLPLLPDLNFEPSVQFKVSVVLQMVSEVLLKKEKRKSDFSYAFFLVSSNNFLQQNWVKWHLAIGLGFEFLLFTRPPPGGQVHALATVHRAKNKQGNADGTNPAGCGSPSGRSWYCSGSFSLFFSYAGCKCWRVKSVPETCWHWVRREGAAVHRSGGASESGWFD